MKQPDSASITRRGFLGVRLGQDVTPTKGFIPQSSNAEFTSRSLIFCSSSNSGKVSAVSPICCHSLNSIAVVASRHSTRWRCRVKMLSITESGSFATDEYANRYVSPVNLAGLIRPAVIDRQHRSILKPSQQRLIELTTIDQTQANRSIISTGYKDAPQ
jgi:hypothetical protein